MTTRTLIDLQTLELDEVEADTMIASFQSVACATV